jgi:hypothetical protein
MPGRLRHRAPLLALGADVKATVAPARQRRVVAVHPSPDLQVRRVRDARVNDDADSAPNGELVTKDHAVAFAERERPRDAAGSKVEDPLRLELGARLITLTACRSRHSIHRVARHVSEPCPTAGRRPAAAGGQRRRQDNCRQDDASRTASPDHLRTMSP